MATEKRLIEKQEVIKLLRGKCISKYPVSFYFGLIAAADEIEKIPEVDAVEVVHGRWLGEAGDFKCSVCGEYSADGGFEQTRFCPNCGAKMDGGADNGSRTC